MKGEKGKEGTKINNLNKVLECNLNRVENASILLSNPSFLCKLGLANSTGKYSLEGISAILLPITQRTLLGYHLTNQGASLHPNHPRDASTSKDVHSLGNCLSVQAWALQSQGWPIDGGKGEARDTHPSPLLPPQVPGQLPAFALQALQSTREVGVTLVSVPKQHFRFYNTCS